MAGLVDKTAPFKELETYSLYWLGRAAERARTLDEGIDEGAKAHAHQLIREYEWRASQCQR